MGFSPLADMNRRIPDVGRSARRNAKITGFGIHHNAGVNMFHMGTNPRYEVSANYWITNEGAILPHIDEDRRAWTSGASGYPKGAQADHRNVTVEVSNSPEGSRNGTWAISDAALKALISLIADVYKRHGLGTVKRGADRGVGVHRDWVPTKCPGDYIMDNLGHIIAEAEKVRSGGKPAPAPKPSKPSTGLPAAGVAMLNGVGIGDSVSIRDWWTYSDAALTKKIATVTGTFEIVGIDYKSRGGVEPSLRIKDAANLRRWVHVSAVDGKSTKVLTRFAGAPAPAKKSNAQIAREIVHGVNGRNPWGNDPQRSQKLRAAGYDPAAVQREVNKLI